MSEYRRQSDRDCEPTKDPAPQPHPPGDGKACGPLPSSTPPTLQEPKCPDPPVSCKCPPTPGSSTNCLQTLIDKQQADILAAEKAKDFQKELQKVLENANKASQTYTRDKYAALVAEWLRQDTLIATLLRNLECAVPCWQCILDCYVCPLLNELHTAEKWLYDDRRLYSTDETDEYHVYDLYDLQYWHQRDKAAKQHTFDRIASVMTAWSDPAKAIETALNANKGLIDSAGKVIGTNEPGKAIYDVFLRIVPLHLAIAPPAGPDTTTKIDKKYTMFCECDEGKPDNCCGLDVGEWSLRQRLIGPQPNLIDPNDYFTLICCLVEQRYAPAKEALSKAETDLAAAGDRIARYEAQLKTGWVKNFETAAKGAIPSMIDCCDYEQDEETTQQKPSRDC